MANLINFYFIFYKQLYKNLKHIRYLDCINETSDCTTNIMRPEVDIKCHIDPVSMKAEWVLDYPKIFDGSVPKQFFNVTIPAR